MFVVIFKAELSELDDDYSALVRKLRDRALDEYNCFDFTSVREFGQEICLSYWESIDDIQKWRKEVIQDMVDRHAWDRWIDSYEIELAEIVRSSSGTMKD